MAVYRVEAAKSARAGCQGPICKHHERKIGKGELRLGVWVQLPNSDNGSFKWRHWGCVTDKVISNLIDEFGDKYTDQLDGYDEIDAEFRAPIDRAFAQGVMPDEDKTPDDRPPPEEIKAMKQAAKLKKAQEAQDRDAKMAAERASLMDDIGVEQASDIEIEADPVPTPPATSAKKGGKKAAKAASSSPASSPTPAKKRGRKSAAEADQTADSAAPVKKGRASKASAAAKIKPEPDVSEDEGELEVPSKKRAAVKARKAPAAKKRKSKKDDYESESDAPEEESAASTVASGESESEPSSDEDEKPKRRSKAAASKRAAPAKRGGRGKKR